MLINMAGDALAGYYDDQIGALVARLEADDPALLAQIRGDAFATRMINILNAIERHTAALTARPDRRTEASFLSRYRRHVIDQHGQLEPPDFDRRRRVPITDIYVPTAITADLSSERASVSPGADRSSLKRIGATAVDMKLEVVVVPISDVGRAKDFHARRDQLRATLPIGRMVGAVDVTDVAFS
jgi:hypothetical protein